MDARRSLFSPLASCPQLAADPPCSGAAGGRTFIRPSSWSQAASIAMSCALAGPEKPNPEDRCFSVWWGVIGSRRATPGLLTPGLLRSLTHRWPRARKSRCGPPESAPHRRPAAGKRGSSSGEAQQQRSAAALSSSAQQQRSAAAAAAAALSKHGRRPRGVSGVRGARERRLPRSTRYAQPEWASCAPLPLHHKSTWSHVPASRWLPGSSRPPPPSSARQRTSRPRYYVGVGMAAPCVNP